LVMLMPNSLPTGPPSGSNASTKSPGGLAQCFGLILAPKDWATIFPVLHNKNIGGEFVPIPCCFRSPENAGVIPLDGA
jgi:hypothetical protein